jgi:hypothetical protein
MDKIKNRIIGLGLSYKNEILKLVSINIAAIIILLGVIIFYFNILLVGSIALLTLLSDYLFLNRYKKLEKINKEKEIEEFINIITYLEIFMSNGLNVYGALNKTSEYASSITKRYLGKLLNDIDEDKSISPFISFAKNYSLRIIENVMISIYQMVDIGENSEQLLQFKFVFERFKDGHEESKMNKKQKNLDMLNSLPLVGAGIITIMVLFGVISIIGGIINVI